MSVLRGLMRTVGAVVGRVPAWEWFVLSKVCLLLQVTWMQVYHAPDERVTLEIAPVKSDVLPPAPQVTSAYRGCCFAWRTNRSYKLDTPSFVRGG